MSERKRLFVLILIMTTVSLIIVVLTIFLLYSTALEEARARLVDTAQSRARLIEAVTRFDAIYSKDYPEGSEAATLSQIIDAHEHFPGFGETGEFTLARREGDEIVFLLSQRHYDLEYPKPISFDSELAEPMRRALSGRSGTVVGLDYRGERVLAAHEPVAELNLGIVAKIDLAEVRAPFVRAGIVAFFSAVFLVLLGAVLFLRVSNPIIRRLEESEARLRRLNEELEQRVKERTAELEQTNKELKETQRQLIHSAKLAAVGKLAAGVAHEINNPLGAISGYIELLEEQEVIDETARGYFARMDKRIFDIARIVKGLKDFSSQSVKSDLNLKPTDVHQVLQEALELTEWQMAHSNIEVIEEWSKDQPLIPADASRLQQVFLDIILNAKDAMPDGGFLTIKTESVDEGKYIQLLFVDTGTGIPKEAIDRIFEPFFTTKPTGQGTGLGLSISYGIINEHSGDIKVESEEGRGSAFKIILPVQGGEH